MFTRLCRQMAIARSSPILATSQRTTGSLFSVARRSYAKEAAPLIGPGLTAEGKAQLEENKQKLYKFIHDALGNEEEAKRIFHYLKHKSNPKQRIYDVERFRRLVLDPHNFAQVPETKINQDQKKRLLAHAFETVNSKWKVDHNLLDDIKLPKRTEASIKAREQKREKKRLRAEYDASVRQEKEKQLLEAAAKMVHGQQ
eukprot:TRINITY_DN11204_c0_g1_i1.p1 TRINITY_DN11204_c0_g1~~TRINITY_DN11204_c0_g1_i1.p1  ORF type:complete len:199 (+),score=49.22 TRINITY_DN11204_c0_g1_i1:64-660(+)